MEDFIDRVSSLRDLGIILSDDGRFEKHIEKVMSKVRQKVGRMMRTFYTRRKDIMVQLWKTLAQCYVDYCSQLYMRGQGQAMQAIKKLVYDFTSKIPGVREENYWSRLITLKMYSQERRMERYRIIYIWKKLENPAPNCGVNLAPENERLGRRCQIPKLKSQGRQAIQTLREQSFQINGARIYNSLPKILREITGNQDKFKYELDKFLTNITDHPRLGQLAPSATFRITGKHSNSFTAWIKEQ